MRAIQERCAATTQRFAKAMLEGKRDFRALWDLPQDLLIGPISLDYYFIGRFLFAKSAFHHLEFPHTLRILAALSPTTSSTRTPNGLVREKRADSRCTQCSELDGVHREPRS